MNTTTTEWVVVVEGDEGGEQGHTAQVVRDGLDTQEEAQAVVAEVAALMGKDAADQPYMVSVLSRQEANELGIE